MQADNSAFFPSLSVVAVKAAGSEVRVVEVAPNFNHCQRADVPTSSHKREGGGTLREPVEGDQQI